MDRIVIFKNPQHQDQFDRDGYVVIDLPISEIPDQLNQLFSSTHQGPLTGGFVSDSFSSDSSWKRSVSDSIKNVLMPAYEEILVDFRSLGGSFIYKTPEADSELQAHQDWTIVDETKYVALNCWVPLSDVDVHNGTLQILPGTHYRNYPSLRAPTIPFFFHGNETLLKPYLVPLVVRKGQAVFLNESVVHYSAANKSNSTRVAVTAGVVSAQAPLVFYYYTDGLLETYAMDDNFLISISNFNESIYQRPAAPKIASEKRLIKPLSKAALEEMLHQLRGAVPENQWWRRFKKGFF